MAENHLPAEIWLMILTFVAPPQNSQFPERSKGDRQARKDLRSLSLVSPLLRDLAQSLLFRCFHETSLNLDDAVSFARAICACPKLGEEVKEFKFLPYIDNARHNEFSGSDHRLFKRALDKDGLSLLKWLPKLHQRNVDFFAAFLVTQTPHIKKLTLKGDISLKPFIKASKRLKSFMSEVKEVTVAGDPAVGRFEISAYTSIYALCPKLNTVTFQYGRLGGDDLEESSTPEAGTLDAEHVKFKLCMMTSSALQKFMRAHKKLLSFTYDNSDPTYPIGSRLIGHATPPDIHFNAAEALEAALIHKETLQTFHLSFENLPHNRNGVVLPQISQLIRFGSFAPFKQLKTIVVPQPYLPIHPELPASIEKLEITQCTLMSIEDFMSNIAYDWNDGKYPALTSINMISSVREIFSGEHFLWEEESQRIQSWFRGVDVTFSYHGPWRLGRWPYWH